MGPSPCSLGNLEEREDCRSQREKCLFKKGAFSIACTSKQLTTTPLNHNREGKPSHHWLTGLAQHNPTDLKNLGTKTNISMLLDKCPKSKKQWEHGEPEIVQTHPAKDCSTLK